MPSIDMSAQDTSVNGGADREALASTLNSYAPDQLVQEVLSAWEDLSMINEEVAGLRQQNRVLELDLKERDDIGSPDRARLIRLEEDLRDREAQIIHLERLVDDGRLELEEISVSSGAMKVDSLERDNSTMAVELEEKTGLLVEMEAKVATLVDALEKAAEAGLTSVTADEVRSLKGQLDSMTKQFEVEQAANKALEEERQRLRDIADRLRGLLDARDGRLGELEEQLERVMQGPRSVSAEHDYLVEQIEELKRRLLERNREYESLRRRERRLHNDVFERDERLQQMSLTLGDMESALQDRTAELREIEGQRETMTHQLDAVRRGERTREVVGRVFADSLSLVRSHDEREIKRENYANSPDVERKLTTPDVKDMAHLAGGGRVELEVEETDIEQGMDVDTNRPAAPGGSGDPVVFDDED